MAIPHLPAMLLFSVLVSVVFGVLSKDTQRDRLIYGVKDFAAFVGFALIIGGITDLIPRGLPGSSWRQCVRGRGGARSRPTVNVWVCVSVARQCRLRSAD